MRVTALLSFILVLSGCAATQSGSHPWPAGDKRAMVDQCHEQVWQRAENDYLKERNQARAQLPPNFRQAMSDKVGPQAAACDCYIDRLESEWSYDELNANKSRVGEKVQQIRASGACRAAAKR
ncbi:MAG TPA: hypothetical protein VNT02_07905 [Burkholderiales bacterium]|nr:hypothetical protein [Burkholderiales bacterium]